MHHHEIGSRRKRGVFGEAPSEEPGGACAYPVVTIHRISGRLLVFFFAGGNHAEVAKPVRTDAILGVPGVAQRILASSATLDIEVM